MNIKNLARSPLGLLVLVLGISLAVFSLANLYFTPVQCVDARVSPELFEVKWDEETLKHMADLLSEEMHHKSASQVSQLVPNNVPMGSDAYWALDSTRDILRANVATARKHFLKTLGEVRKSGGWNSSNHQPGFTRAVIVYLPGDLGRQHSREF